MILLKFEREKGIWQSFLLTNYCNFPRRIFVTGGKHKASKRSDLPLFTSSCWLRRGGQEKPPRASTSALAAPPSIPSSRGFYSILFWKNWLFPFAERCKFAFFLSIALRGDFTSIKGILPKCCISWGLGMDAKRQEKSSSQLFPSPWDTTPGLSHRPCLGFGSVSTSVPGAAWRGRGRSSPSPRISPPWTAGACSPAAFAPVSSLPCSGWGTRC